MQAVGTDLFEALTSIDVTVAILKKWRSEPDETFGKLFSEVAAIASEIGVQLAKPRTATRSIYRSNAVSQSTNSADDIESYYRIVSLIQ